MMITWGLYITQLEHKKRTFKSALGNSLVVQWLGLCAFTAEGPGSVSGQGTKIPQATQHSQKKKKKISPR